MKNMVKKITTVLVAAVMLLPLFTAQSSAASSVFISTKDSINGGDTFTVTVTYDGSNIGRVDAGLNYDTDKLAYISGGSGSGNCGRSRDGLHLFLHPQCACQKQAGDEKHKQSLQTASILTAFTL